jgi:hypothetical protein
MSASVGSSALIGEDRVDPGRLIGDGDGEVRPARRRSRSRPPGVLKRTSWEDLGGQFSFALAADT